MATEILADGLQGAEGPVWAPDGKLYVTESGGGRITAIAPDGSKSTFADTGGSPNGAALDVDGYLYVTNNGAGEPGSIQKIDPSGNVETLYNEWEGQPFKAPNDLVLDAHGGFYFTDPGRANRESLRFGHLYYGLTDGTWIKRMQYLLYFPNGIALTPDGSTLVFVETLTSRVWGIPIESPGTLATVDAGVQRRVPVGRPDAALLTHVPGLFYPDGICFDEVGNLFVCANMGGFVSVHAPNGDPITRIDVEDKGITNCCFGGDDFQTLYITESGLGRVSTARWERSGLRLNDH